MKRTTSLIFMMMCCLTYIQADMRLTSFRLTSDNGLPDNNIRYMRQDSTGCLQLLSLYEAYEYDGYAYRKMSDADFLQLRERGRHVSRGGKGFIYDNIGTKVLTAQGDYIVYIDKTTGEHIPLKVFTDNLLRLNNSLKCCVVTDRNGYVWVSVNGNGLFLYNRSSKQLRHITAGDGSGLIDTDNIVFMMLDKDGNVWASQEHYGLACLHIDVRDNRIVNLPSTSTGQHNNEVRMICRLDDGSFLIANNLGTLIKADGNLQTLSVLRESPYNYGFAALDGSDRLWLGTMMRGLLVNGKEYGKGRVDYILRDSRNRMWVCGIDGALKQVEITADGQYKERLFLDKIEGLGPRTMKQDHRGTVWLGTDKGLFAFQPDALLKNPKSYRKVTDVPVRCILEDSSHQLWIGTVGKGVGRMQSDGTFSYISRADGLPNNVVQQLIEDTHHNICIGTENGLARYEPKTGIIRTIYSHESRIRNFYNEDCCSMLADGSMAYGSLDGFMVVAHDARIIDRTPRQAELTDIVINGISCYDMGEDSPLQESLGATKRIVLDHHQNSLTFRFTDFDIGKTQQTRYAYRLDNYDQNWSVQTELNFATYKNLKPGTYVFRVKCYEEGLKSAEGKERLLTVIISPPWWATWWAYIIYCLIASGMGFLVYRQLKHVQQLRQRIAVEHQLTDFKLKFFTNISHEFRTPLTLIQGAMEKIQETKEVPGSMKQPLSNMRQSTERMLRLVNQFLEFRRLQNNKLSLTLEKTDVVQFVYNIYMSFYDLADKHKIAYSFIPFEHAFSMYVDRGHIDKMVYNLLSNAFKYTPDGGSVVVRLKKQDDKLYVMVEDTGIGVSPEKQAELFNRFSTGRVSGDSLGIGLNLAHELALVHHGDITYQANDPKGSVFTIVLPTSGDVYAETDFMKTNTGLKEDEQQVKVGFESIYQEQTVNPLNNRRILVVDDSQDILQMIQHELSVYFVVDTAKSGEEALALLREHNNQSDGEEGDVPTSPYELIISDVKMPQMSGYELTRKIRSDQSFGGIPVILLSSLAGDDMKHKGLDAGADAVMEKPFSVKALTSQALNLIEQRDHLKQIYAKQPQKQNKPELVRADIDKKFIHQLDAFIEGHLGDSNLSIDMLTEHFRMGRTTFFNKVRSLTGFTPNDYIREKRLSRAAELLRDEISITVSEVAYQTGFSNAQYLSVSFKKKYGMSPSAYQRTKS